MTFSKRRPFRLVGELMPALGIVILLFGGCVPGPRVKPATATAQPPAPVDTSFNRSQALSSAHGMIVSAHPLASQIGLRVLESGGSAVDAAVAAVAALNVTEPHASGLGGGGFLLHFDARSDSFVVIDYRERAPLRLERARYFQPADTLRLMQRTGATSVCVPGAAAGWQAMHDRFGTRLLSELILPAAELADSGYPVSEKQSALILDHFAEIVADSNLSRVFLADSLPLSAGSRLRQPRLAELLRFLAKTRLTNFYHYPVGERVVQAIAARGGSVSREDLLSYQVQERTPLRGTYRGYEVITLPPPASGGTALLEILKLIEPGDLTAMGHLSPEYIHTLACAMRQALKDGDTWVADPDFNFVPAGALVSDGWIAEARARMKSDSVPDRIMAMDSVRAFAPGNTTHLVVVDSAGNLVSLTQSINYFFGSGVMVPEYGLLLNNHLADFSNDSTGARAMAPGRRPPSNMAATIVRKEGKPILVIGSPGGARIAPALAQVLVGVLDFGLPLNEALDAPRFFPAGKTLVVETRIPKATLDKLSAKGWKIYPFGPVNAYFGGVHAIQIDPESGYLTGAADPRRDGAAAGY